MQNLLYYTIQFYTILCWWKDLSLRLTDFWSRLSTSLQWGVNNMYQKLEWRMIDNARFRAASKTKIWFKMSALRWEISWWQHKANSIYMYYKQYIIHNAKSIILYYTILYYTMLDWFTYVGIIHYKIVIMGKALLENLNNFDKTWWEISWESHMTNSIYMYSKRYILHNATCIIVYIIKQW